MFLITLECKWETRLINKPQNLKLHIERVGSSKLTFLVCMKEGGKEENCNFNGKPVMHLQ